MAKSVKQSAGNLLDQLDVAGGFQALVRKAVLQGWDLDEFAQALASTKRFRRAFPGLIQNGTVHTDFGGGSGYRDLLSGVKRYNDGYDNFQAIARSVGYPGKVSKQAFGLAIRRDVSPDEFAGRVKAITTVKQNPGLLEAFNEQLKLSGQKPLDQMGFLKFVAGAAAPKFYDTYEAAQLKASGLFINPESAARVAKAIGEPGATSDIGGLIAQLHATIGDIGPELARSGITLEEAAVSLSKGGQDAEGIGNTLRAIIEQRRALKNYQPGIQGQRGPGGGLSLYQDDNNLFAE